MYNTSVGSLAWADRLKKHMSSSICTTQKKAVADFDSGTCFPFEVVQQCNVAYGEQRNTLVLCCESVDMPKISRPTAEDTSGYDSHNQLWTHNFMHIHLCNYSVFQSDQHDQNSVSCNTQKDKDDPKTHHTAGINKTKPLLCMLKESIAGLHVYIGTLDGVWPCGIVAFLSELFIGESKTQVHGALHSF